TSTPETPFKPSSAFLTACSQCSQVMPDTFNVVCILKTPFYSCTFLSLNEFVTTLTELNAIAAPAIQGARSPIAAIGMPALLYAKAQNKFCLMLRIVLWLSVIAFGIRVNSPPRMVIRSEERRVGKECRARRLRDV